MQCPLAGNEESKHFEPTLILNKVDLEELGGPNLVNANLLLARVVATRSALDVFI